MPPQIYSENIFNQWNCSKGKKKTHWSIFPWTKMKLFLRSIKISLPWHPSLATCLPNCCKLINQKWIRFCKNKINEKRLKEKSTVLEIIHEMCYILLLAAAEDIVYLEHILMRILSKNCFLELVPGTAALLQSPWSAFSSLQSWSCNVLYLLANICCRKAHSYLCGWLLVRLKLVAASFFKKLTQLLAPSYCSLFICFLGLMFLILF